jgi:LysR family glycine cleavage system transcriptional activator
MLVAADLAAGRLVRPFRQALTSASQYFVVYPPRAIHQRKVKAFRDWLVAEIGHS